MITAAEAARSLFGAWRLAHFDPRGMSYLDASVAGFWRSFQAALVALPVYAVIVAMRGSGPTEGETDLHFFAIEAIAYAVAWTLFPVVAHTLVEALGRQRRYNAYIVAYNWANVLQLAATLPIVALAWLSVGPDLVLGLLTIAITIAILAYLHFIARTALDIDALPAMGLVAIDVLLGVLLDGVVDWLHGAGA